MLTTDFVSCLRAACCCLLDDFVGGIFILSLYHVLQVGLHTTVLFIEPTVRVLASSVRTGTLE